MKQKYDFWIDPRYGSVAWPVTTAICFYRGMVSFAILSAFFAIFSIYRWIKH